jgi:dTDP-4-dehydrorhamnose reductase
MLVTGANGFLGQHLCVFLSSRNFTVTGCGRDVSRIPAHFNINFYSVDLTDSVLVDTMIERVQPDVIVHTAAMSKPDECHVNRAEAYKQNVTATENLLNAANVFFPADRRPHFIYTSTDFIFPDNGPHSEEEAAAPLNYYGETKLIAEEKVKASGLRTTIVRPVFIYGKIWEGLRPAFVHWVKNNLEAGKQIKVVTDQKRTPTYAEDICAGIQTIIENKATGVYHLAGPDILSPYEMAVKTAEVLQLDTLLIIPVSSETFPEPVQRAKRSGLKIDKARSELNYQPLGFEEGLRRSFS